MGRPVSATCAFEARGQLCGVSCSLSIFTWDGPEATQVAQKGPLSAHPSHLASHANFSEDSPLQHRAAQISLIVTFRGAPKCFVYWGER